MAKELIFATGYFGMNDEINDAILCTHVLGHLIGTTLIMDRIAS